MKPIFLLVMLFFLLYGFSVHAQTASKPSKKSSGSNQRDSVSPYALTVRGGLTQFFGELNEQDMLGSAGIGLERSFNKSISGHLEFTAGKIGGQKRELFNSYFVNEYNGFEVFAKWNLTRQFSHQKSDMFDISIYGGVGLMIFSAKAHDLTTHALLRFTNSTTSKRNQLFLRWGNPGGRAGVKKTNERFIPIGTSVAFIGSERWKMGLDYRFYFVRTDKLDATSGQRLINPEEADSYSDTPNDKFGLLSVSLTYCFPKSGSRQ
jgi:hypothetical protein